MDELNYKLFQLQLWLFSRDELNDVSRYPLAEEAKTEDNLWRKERQVMREIDDPTVLNKVRSRAVFGWNRIVILFCVFTLLWA